MSSTSVHFTVSKLGLEWARPLPPSFSEGCFFFFWLRGYRTLFKKLKVPGGSQAETVAIGELSRSTRRRKLRSHIQHLCEGAIFLPSYLLGMVLAHALPLNSTHKPIYTTLVQFFSYLQTPASLLGNCATQQLPQAAPSSMILGMLGSLTSSIIALLGNW